MLKVPWKRVDLRRTIMIRSSLLNPNIHENDMDICENPEVESRPRIKISQNQMGLLVDFMTLNPELVWGASSEHSTKIEKRATHKKWEELAALLNADGTGPEKTVRKWKKSWSDVKCNLRYKVEKVAAIHSADDEVLKMLSYLERRIWNLMCSTERAKREQKPEIEAPNRKNDLMCAIVCDVDYQPAIVNATKAQTGNSILVGQLEYAQTETENAQRGTECSNDILDVPNDEDSSDASSDGLAESGSENVTVPEISLNLENEEIAQEGNIKPAVQSSSNNTPKKRLQLPPPTRAVKRRKISVANLLIKQNVLLENIAQSLTRIEKSLAANSPQQSKAKNDILSNIVQNIDKITESFDSVSTSLKKMAEK